MKKMILSAFLFLPFHYIYSAAAYSKGDTADTLSDAKKYTYSESLVKEDYSAKDNCLWIKIPKMSADSLLYISGVYTECSIYSDNELIGSSTGYISDIPSMDFFAVSGAQDYVYVKIIFNRIEKLKIKSKFVSPSKLSKEIIDPEYILTSILLLSLLSLAVVLFMKTGKKKLLSFSFILAALYLISQILAYKQIYDAAKYFSYSSFASMLVLSFYLCSKKKIYKSFPAVIFSIIIALLYFGFSVPYKYLPALGLIPFVSVFFIVKDEKNIEKILIIIAFSLIPFLQYYSNIEFSLLSACAVFISYIIIFLVSVLRLIVFHEINTYQSVDYDSKIKLLSNENVLLAENYKKITDERLLTENAVIDLQKKYSDERFFSAGWECSIISDSKFLKTDIAAFIDCGSYAIAYIIDIEGHSIDKSMISMYFKQEISRYINNHNEKLTLFSSFLQNISDKFGLNYLRGTVIKLNGDYAEYINYSYPDCYYVNARALNTGKLTCDDCEKLPVMSGRTMKNLSKMYRINNGDYLIMYSDSLKDVMEGFITGADFSGGIEKLCRRMKEAFKSDDFNDDITIVILRRNQ
ncbi:MAG TPA: SpoIIE family protein phosphatase [Spirochaetota bacterium]|nr:SpoIIE family protein phosphatase [Spirochaetota bacterium]HOR45139.1 SpoIIE family protein phosphatase [Spirochaetota bacterium]HOU84164.1 SpoIIE family protein phosphatase [Spirochaetota bacterium]HPK56745.1 SpoIIE family protein phosphatase [Spirochaetota bacterium]HQE59136.1 SpoIIE family protein phosphatase [Spirochaetota bacterium]